MSRAKVLPVLAMITVSVLRGFGPLGTETPACTYAISPGGQTFTAAGGNGTINITADAGCPWTAASAVTWVTIAGVATGSGNGIIAYQDRKSTRLNSSHL